MSSITEEGNRDNGAGATTKPKKGSDAGDESLADLLTFAKGKVADRVRSQAKAHGLLVEREKIQASKTLSATEQMKIDAREKKKTDAIQKERGKKKAMVAQGIRAILPVVERLNEIEENNSLGATSDGKDVVVPDSPEEALKLFKTEFSKGQKFAQKKEFTKALDSFKVAFKYLPSKTSKFAGICVGSAASAEYQLGELRNAKRHATQSLDILKGLPKRDETMEKHVESTLKKILEDLGEKEEIAVDLASLGL